MDENKNPYKSPETEPNGTEYEDVRAVALRGAKWGAIVGSALPLIVAIAHVILLAVMAARESPEWARTKAETGPMLLELSKGLVGLVTIGLLFGAVMGWAVASSRNRAKFLKKSSSN